MSEKILTERYQLQTPRILPASVLTSTLELAQKIPGIHEVMREPLDITNHAGNMYVGAAAATVVSLAFAAKGSEKDISISNESMKQLRRFGIAAACGATAVINCMTETRWGVSHLPVAEWVGGKTPDSLDTLYSTVWAGVTLLAFWKKIPSSHSDY
jgi:hypothetical protein